MNPIIINYATGDNIQLVVTHADNVLTGYLADSGTSRRQIYGRMTDFAITFNDTIDIGHSLNGANNVLILTGLNFTGGGQMTFSILVNGAPQQSVDVNLPIYTSQAWAYQFALQ